MKLEKAKYTAKASAKGGKVARVTTGDGLIDLEYRPPKEIDGTGETGSHTNAEQLLAAGYATCMSSTLELAAEKMQLDINPDHIFVEARVQMGNDEQASGFAYLVDLEIGLNSLDKETLEKLTQIAHKDCPYSKALQGNVDVRLHLQ